MNPQSTSPTPNDGIPQQQRQSWQFSTLTLGAVVTAATCGLAGVKCNLQNTARDEIRKEWDSLLFGPMSRPYGALHPELARGYSPDKLQRVAQLIRSSGLSEETIPLHEIILAIRASFATSHAATIDHRFDLLDDEEIIKECILAASNVEKLDEVCKDFGISRNKVISDEELLLPLRMSVNRYRETVRAVLNEDPPDPKKIGAIVKRCRAYHEACYSIGYPDNRFRYSMYLFEPDKMEKDVLLLSSLANNCLVTSSSEPSSKPTIADLKQLNEISRLFNLALVINRDGLPILFNTNE